MKQKKDIDTQAIIAFTQQGKDYSEIRDMLVENGYNDEEIRHIMKVVDHEHMLVLAQKKAIAQAKNIMLMGFVLFGAGIFITIYSYIVGEDSFTLAYGAILSGLGLIYKGYKDKKNLSPGFKTF